MACRPKGKEYREMKQPTGGAVSRGLAALALASALVSCGGNTATSATAPTLTTEQFNGSLVPGGSVTFPFTAVSTGAVSATLTTLTPQTTITVGFGIGQPSGGACLLISGAYSETEKAGVSLSDTISPGSYCVELYDIGNVSSTDSFTITVTHP
jgi:hypothetical protein